MKLFIYWEYLTVDNGYPICEHEIGKVAWDTSVKVDTHTQT